MVEEYEEIADSQYPSERLEYLEEDFGKTQSTDIVPVPLIYLHYTLYLFTTKLLILQFKFIFLSAKPIENGCVICILRTRKCFAANAFRTDWCAN